MWSIRAFSLVPIFLTMGKNFLWRRREETPSEVREVQGHAASCTQSCRIRCHCHIKGQDTCLSMCHPRAWKKLSKTRTILCGLGCVGLSDAQGGLHTNTHFHAKHLLRLELHRQHKSREDFQEAGWRIVGWGHRLLSWIFHWKYPSKCSTKRYLSLIRQATWLSCNPCHLPWI